MRIVTTSYAVVGPKGRGKITLYRIKGLRLRKLVPVRAHAQPKRK